MSTLQQNCRKGQNRFCLEARWQEIRGRNVLNNVHLRINEERKKYLHYYSKHVSIYAHCGYTLL
jgi:hypothetical protein